MIRLTSGHLASLFCLSQSPSYHHETNNGASLATFDNMKHVGLIQFSVHVRTNTVNSWKPSCNLVPPLQTIFSFRNCVLTITIYIVIQGTKWYLMIPLSHRASVIIYKKKRHYGYINHIRQEIFGTNCIGHVKLRLVCCEQKEIISDWYHPGTPPSIYVYPKLN